MNSNIMTKREIQEELRERGIDFNSKANKSVLEALLRDHVCENIQEGIEGIIEDIIDDNDDDFPIDKYSASYKCKGKLKFLGHYATEKDALTALLAMGARGRVIKHVTK